MTKLPITCPTVLLGAVLTLPLTVSAKVDFKTEILPVLEQKCLKCHSAPKEENGKMVNPKAGLRLDAAWAMLKGGESKRPSLVPKDLAKSYMYEVVNLPKDDDSFMPPKGDPLTPAEITKLKTWIEEGGDFGGWEGNLVGKPADPGAVAKAPPKDREHELLYKALSEGLQPASAEVLKKAKDAGAQASALMVNSPLLRVDFLTGVSRCDDASIQNLLVLKENVAHLDLARTNVTDVALQTLAQFPRLTRLDLRKTKVTDKGVESLTALKHLTYLNLYGTEITDASLTALAGMKTLRNLYLWETKATEPAVAKLKAALPQTEIVHDVEIAAPEGAAAGEEKMGKKKKNK
ncbi:MAG: c-type cytochrome domain-containing protein [Verrucomicrobium sp.]|nr:c-type cytochrome domain-containing protein [Verrucomicrobium sp.]